MFGRLKESFKESFYIILPIVLVTLLLSAYITIPNRLINSFVFSSILLVIGISLFTFGVDISMTLVGEKIGNKLIEKPKIWLILIVSFIIGTVVTIAEPDLKVFADQLTSIPNSIMIITISVGVGILLLISSIRTIFGLNLNTMLVISYVLILILMFFVPKEFVPVAFDSGGITTGTISIPFIMTLGIGLTEKRTDKKAQESSFGLISLCSIGPIITMLLLGLIYPYKGGYTITINETVTIMDYLKMMIISMKDVIISLLPILVVFLLFQLITKELTKRDIHKVVFGTIVLFIGLVFFFTGANVGFIDFGYYIGEKLAEVNKILLIVFSAVVAYFIAIAEPAVQILNEQVENITEGNISKKTMNRALALGVSLATVLSIVRIITATSFIYYILIIQVLSIILIFFTPKIFNAVAFDAGGATGGTLTIAFLLPIAIGTCLSTGENILLGAFGLAAFVSIVPILTIQIVGIFYKQKMKEIRKVYDLDDSIVEFGRYE